MKIRRVLQSDHSFSTLPAYAYQDFLTLDDLIMLRRTHQFFLEKLCKIATPTINIFYKQLNMLAQFPKARLMANKTSGIDGEDLTIFPRITCLDISHNSNCNVSEHLSLMTKLTELNMRDNVVIRGPVLRKLTLVRKLVLDLNTVITDLDIEALPLRSLSIAKNRIITPLVLRKLNLTHLNINDYTTSRHSIELGDEIIRCVTITDLELYGTDAYAIGFKTMDKMTWLRKLTIDEQPFSDYGNHLKCLTNLTYLEIKNGRRIQIGMAVLQQLETLIITKGIFVDIPSMPMTNLTRLEISADASYTLNYGCLRNLTHLDLGEGSSEKNLEIAELKKLRKLILRNVNYSSYVNIFCVVELEICYCDIAGFAGGGGDRLESLTVNTLGAIIDDDDMVRFPNLKYFSMGRAGCAKVTGTCFKDMEQLYSLTISKYNNLDPSCIAELNRAGIMIKYTQWI
ncbi:MAG: hypothetical protein Hyperionvirus2_39 [Hyperionvirus sp.]|uniref:Leucine-rich repeat protein n=1 Tax=Hyperionvirus sp. TaxID=2487770 RepID=A0A3G5A916_9VIRU|nr:MAG: hypothetical protein Hyperionvirus2_39 [Hyperionvirus sp.]